MTSDSAGFPATKRRVLAQVLICATGCCCGRTEKGKPPVPVSWLKAEWKQRKLLKTVQLTISGCLGPCDVPNVICIQTSGEAVWLGNVTLQHQYEALVAWAQACADLDLLVLLPDLLHAHRFSPYRSTEAPIPAAIVPVSGH